MAFKLDWPYKYKLVRVYSDGKFGRKGKYDWYYPKGVKTRLPHQGSDYRIPCGIRFYSPVAGRVDILEKRNYGYGYYVRIKFGNKHIGFAHNSQLYIKLGQTIKKDQLLGLTGSTGAGKGCHSHIELRINGKVVNPETMIKWEVDMYKGKNAESWYKGYQHALKVATTRSNRFGVIAKRLAKDLDKPIPKPDDFKTILSYLNLFITKKEYEEALQYAQDQYDQVSKQRLENHNVETERLEDEISDLEIKLEGLEEEIKTFTEPTTVKIPRVTKFDNLWDKIRKRILQFISSRKKVI